jgi:YbbR domain-containing protein
MKNRFSKIWTTLKKEKGLLLICWILAFLSWQGISKNIGNEVLISNIKIDVDAPDGWAVWEKSVQQVNVLFRGSHEDIRYLNNDQLKVVIPVTEPTAGNEVPIKLSGKHLKNLAGAKVVGFNPSHVFIKLDQESERLLPVKAAISGSLPEGLEIDKIVCTPASVRVSGAHQLINDMQNIHTEPIELKDKVSSFKESVMIALPQTGRMRVDPEWVKVDFALVQRSSTEEFNNIPVRVLFSSEDRRDIKISQKTIDITVKGQKQRIDQLRNANVFAYVSCIELQENTGYDLPVFVDLPEGLQLVKTEPAVIHVTIGGRN